MSLTKTHIGLIRAAFTAAGEKLPEAVDQAVADYDKLVAATKAVPVVSTAQIQDAIADALLEGRDPLDDEQVRRLTTAHALTGPQGQSITYGVPLAGERRIVAALNDAVDDILATLHDAADKAGRTLADAHPIIGNHNLHDSELILRLGPKAARAWAEVRDAVAALKTIDRAWSSLAELTSFASTSTAPTLRLADLDLDTFDKVGRKADAWTLVRAAATIDLADRDTIRERTKRITDARQRRQAAHADSFRQTYRRAHGAGVG